MKLTTEQFKKANSIACDVESLLFEQEIIDEESFFSGISAIICAFDTDVAIDVLERFKGLGEEQALSIKVNYGY